MMKKIKICFISVFAYGLFNKEASVNFGGAEVQLYQLAQKFSDDRHYEVDFIVGGFGQKKVESFGNVKVWRAYPLKLNIWQKFLVPYYLASFILLLIRINPDICIQRAAGIETGIIGFYCKLFRKKFIYMTASIIDIDGSFIKNNGLRGRIYKFGLRHAYRVITQAKEHQAILFSRYAIKAQIIKNWFSLPLEQSVLQQDEKTILWIASAQSSKQPEKFLRLAIAFPTENFIMIMPRADEKLWNEIRQKAKKIDNLEFIEKVPFEKIEAYYAKAKIFINTSDFEGFPNTFVQSAMHGTPIVSLNVNPDNFLNEYNCGYCAEGSEERLKESVAKLLNDEKDWKNKSTNAYAYVKKNHDIQEIKKQWDGIIQAIL